MIQMIRYICFSRWLYFNLFFRMLLFCRLLTDKSFCARDTLYSNSLKVLIPFVVPRREEKIGASTCRAYTPWGSFQLVWLEFDYSYRYHCKNTRFQSLQVSHVIQFFQYTNHTFQRFDNSLEETKSWLRATSSKVAGLKQCAFVFLA